MSEIISDKIQYNVLFRACDETESINQVKRPFALSKLQTIKLCFYSQKMLDFQLNKVYDGEPSFVCLPIYSYLCTHQTKSLCLV